MKRVVWCGVLSLVCASLAAAQGPGVSDRVVKAQGEKFMPALCPMKPDGKTKEGISALQKAVGEKEAARREKALADAEQLLIANAVKAPEKDSGPAWYYVARAYLYRGDAAGADSAFAKAEQRLPDCAEDIRQYRQNTWVALVNPAIEMTNSGQTDSALVLLNAANRIFSGLPQGFQQAALIYDQQNQPDSVIKYLEKAVAASGSDTTYTETRKSLTQYLGQLYLKVGRAQDAVKLFRSYLATYPNEASARMQLAVAFREAGMPDSAKALEGAILQAGEVSATDLFNLGVGFFNDKQYDKAADAFSKVIAKEPGNRDALFNLANTYFALKDAAKQLEAAEKLAAIDPLNDQGQRLLAQAHQVLGHQDQTIRIIETLEASPITVEVSNFSPSESGAKLQGEANGRLPKKLDGTELKPLPVTLVFEFLDGSGQVVATQEVEVPVLKPDQSFPIRLQVQGAGIASWRYKKKA